MGIFSARESCHWWFLYLNMLEMFWNNFQIIYNNLNKLTSLENALFCLIYFIEAIHIPILLRQKIQKHLVERKSDRTLYKHFYAFLLHYCMRLA